MSSIGTVRTKDQLRAERANQVVTALKADVIRDYTSEVRALPSMIHQAGLAPALANLRAKGGAAKNHLYDHLSAWISETSFGDPKGDVLALIIANRALMLLQAQEEALLMCGWLKRFAEAREAKVRKA